MAMRTNKGKYRVLLHLEKKRYLDELKEPKEVPYGLCQNGIADSVDLSRSRVSEIIKDLIDENLIEENISRVKGLKRRRKVYSLTSNGYKKAEELREEIVDKKITVKTGSSQETIKLQDINSYIESETPLISALNEIDDSNTIDLTSKKISDDENFVGREKEKRYLNESLEEVKKDRPLTILIKGNAGVGKTKLVYKFKRTVQSEGLNFLVGKGYHNFSRPYLSFEEAFKPYLDDEEHMPLEFSDKAIKEKGKRKMSPGKRESNRDLIFSATLENIRYMAEKQAMVIFIDDFQWIDRASLMLFYYLTENLEDAPVLLLGAYRPEDIRSDGFVEDVIQRMRRKNLVEELKVKPFEFKATKNIIRMIIEKENIPDDFVSLIHETSEGNPLFCEELVKELLVEEMIDPDKERYPTEKDEINIPSVVNEIIERRIKRLNKDDLRVLRIGSVIGEDIQFSLLHSITGIDGFDLLESTDILTGIGLWQSEPNEDVFHFDHGLVHMTVYENIPESLRKNMHKTVAENIENIYSENLDDYYFNIGYHYEKAEEYSEAFNYYLKAGEKAKEIYAHEDAIEIYKRAIDLSKECQIDPEERAKTLEDLADIHKTIGRYDEALNFYEKVLDEKLDDRYISKIYRKIAMIYNKKGFFDKSLDYLNMGLEEDEEVNIETCRIQYLKGWTCMKKGLYESAEKNIKEALKIIGKDRKNKKELADIYHALGIINYHKDRYHLSLKYLEKGLAIRNETENIQGQASSLVSIANVYLNIGQVNEALENFEKSLKIFKKIGDKSHMSTALNNIGNLYIKKGRLEKAYSHYEKSYEIVKEIDDERGKNISLNNLGNYYLIKGELEKAKKHYKNSLKLSENKNFKYGLSLGYLNMGSYYKYINQIEKSKSYYEKSIDLCREIENKNAMIHGLLDLSEILVKEDKKEAQKMAEEALEISDEIGAKAEKGICHRTLGIVYRHFKEWNKSKMEFKKGKKILNEISHKIDLAKLIFQFALLWKDMGENKKWRNQIKKARKMFEDIGMELWIEKCDKELNDRA